LKRLIIGLLFIVIGGGLISSSSRSTSKVSATKAWPTAEGTVLSSEVAVDTIKLTGGRLSEQYRADVRYRFLVDGGRYESNVFVLGPPKSFADRAEAEKVVEAHPAGGPVTVHYEPGNPARSALEHGGTIPQAFGLMTLTAGMFLLIGLLLAISGALGWARSELVGR
jgi:Protein of unknown function (DUF3592)